MFRLNSFRFTKPAIFLGILILSLCFFLNLSKGPHLIHKVSTGLDKTERLLKFSFHPGLTVPLESNLFTEALPNHRAAVATGPLKVNPDNPRYFLDGSGKTIYLTGSHTWSNLQDSGSAQQPPPFDYQTYLDFLERQNHNFFRLWTWEEPGPWIQTVGNRYWFTPMPYQRTSRLELGNADDGEPKFDLTRFSQDYFDRLHDRIKAAHDRGIYVSVMLFNGWSVASHKASIRSSNPWLTHPFNGANNINQINGDFNGDNSGEEIQTLAAPKITKIQEAYVRRVIDTVNQFDNVLFEISNESHRGSRDWQYHMIQYIKDYEAKKPKQHPVGMTAFFPDCGSALCMSMDNLALLNSPADWISLNTEAYFVNQNLAIDEPSMASGHKVILADTDHICGICGEPTWVWKSFTRGENPVFMDAYDNAFTSKSLLKNNTPSDSLNFKPWVQLRRNLGYALTYANRMDLSAMTPDSQACSTGYCLVKTTANASEYLAYAPEGGKVTIDLSPIVGELVAEWFNPATGMITGGIRVSGGGYRSFVPPFDGDAVLYLKSGSTSLSSVDSNACTGVVGSGFESFKSLSKEFS